MNMHHCNAQISYITPLHITLQQLFHICLTAAVQIQSQIENISSDQSRDGNAISENDLDKIRKILNTYVQGPAN